MSEKNKNPEKTFLTSATTKRLLNDVKNIYKTNLNKTSIVGIDMVFEKPLKSNLIVNVDEEDVNTSFTKILNYLKSRTNDL